MSAPSWIDSLLTAHSLLIEPSLEAVLNQAFSLTQTQLQGFANDSEFVSKMATAFETTTALDSLQSAWSTGELSNFPAVEIRYRAELNGVNGAYSAETGTIYLAYEYLEYINAAVLGGDSQAIANLTAVVIEEYGHHVDVVLNGADNDSQGDEGKIFSALVMGEPLSETTLTQLKTENDHGWINLDGQVIEVENNEDTWETLADVPFTYGISAGGGLATDGTYLYAADFSGDGNDDYIDLNGDLVDDPNERLDNLGITNGSVRFGRYNPETDTWDPLPTLNLDGVDGDAFSSGNLVNPLFVSGDTLYYYQFRSGPQIAALYSYDLTTGTTGTWTQEWEKTTIDSPLIDSNAGLVGVDVDGEPVILHHVGGGQYNFARTDNIDGGGTHTQLTPNWNFTGQHFPRGGDWEYNATNDRLYHLSGDQLVMWTNNETGYPEGSFLTSIPDGETPLASQQTLIYSLNNDLGWTSNDNGTSLWGNSVTATGNVLYLLRGETSNDTWPFNEGRGLINNADFARVILSETPEGIVYVSDRQNLPDAPFNIGKGSASVYLNGYLYVTQGDTLTVADDQGNVDPLRTEGIRSPGSGFARFAIDITDDNYEDNDTLATAYDLTASEGVLLSSINGQGISYAGDQDWYKVTVDAGEEYFSTIINFPTNSRYLDLGLYNPSGTLIASGLYRPSSITGNFQQEITTILDPGDYYLRINSPSSDPNTNQISNSYDLSWSTQVLSSVPDEFEDNNTLETAADIREQEGIYLTNLLLLDEDWYQIEATTGESFLRVRYELGNLTHPVTLNLYDAEGTLITSETLESSPYSQYFETQLTSDGIYYLQWVAPENDNTYSFDWETFGLPNLTVTDASTASINPEPNENISVSWTVENIGGFDTWESWSDGVYLSDDSTFDPFEDIFLTSILTDYHQFDPLIPGDSYTQTVEVTLPDFGVTNNQYLLFITDFDFFEPNGIQPESNENDNVYSLFLGTAGNGSDLVITEVSTPASSELNSYIDVSWTVQNQGTVATASNVWYDEVYFSTDDVLDEGDIYLYDEPIQYYDFGEGEEFNPYNLPLNPEDSYTITRSIYLPDYDNELNGNGYLIFATDRYDYEIEIDENNNTFAVPFEVTTPPPPPIVGTISAIDETITGSLSVDDALNPTRSGRYSDDYTLTDVNPGETVSIGLTAPFDTYLQLINADTQALITSDDDGGEGLNSLLTFTAEADTNYIVRVTSFSSGATGDYTLTSSNSFPNLVVREVTAPTTATTGQSVTLSWTVDNIGSATTGTFWYDRVVFSENDIFGDSDDVYLYEEFVNSFEGLPLEPTETYTINRTFNLSGQAVGSGYLLFKTDNYNNQQETNENDNVYSQAINITAPNLTLSGATAPDTAILGETLSVSWTVENNGTVAANADWYDRVVISSDQSVDFSDTYVTEIWQGSRSPLGTGGSYTETRDLVIPTTATGDRYLIFIADQYNQQGETDETDNTFILPISLSAPDLIISDATAPSRGVSNQEINVSWTVTNQGEVAAPADWFDYVYLSTDDTIGGFGDIFITSESISPQTPLAPEGNYTIDRSLTLPNVNPGDYYLIFRADGNNAQGETNDNNNDLAIAITIGAPDLMVSAATAPESGALGETVSLSWTVENQSTTEEAPGDWFDYVYWSSDDTYDFSDTFITSISAASQTPIEPGGSYTQTQDITLPTQTNFIGDGYLIFRTDGNNAQIETDETNNDRAVAFRIDAPDLTVSDASAPESVTVGATFAVSWDVTNQGTVAANADWYDSVYISSDQTFDSSDQYLTALWQGSNTPLDANATYTSSRNISLPSTETGDRYLLFVTDSIYTYSSSLNNRQGETDETNNVRAVPINISASDLTITATDAPETAVLGDTVELTWTVSNQGTGTATRDWYDRVYLSSNQTLDGSDVQVTAEYIATQTPLEVGANYTISKNVVLPSFATGDQYLIFATDHNNRQGEINENNNLTVVPITLTAPDLIVSSATVPTIGTLGKSIEVSWTVQNQGTTSAATDWYDRIYLSNDAVFDANADTLVTQELISEQTPLGAGEEYTVTRNLNLPNFSTGDRYLIFVADGSGNQGETDNNNNARAVAINLNAPDLVVSDINAPVESLSGQPIDVSWTVTNQGPAEAEGTWWDRVYLVNASTGAFVRDLGYFNFTGNIASGESIERTQSFTLPLDLTGDYQVAVTTDYYGNLPEGTQNESNNTTTDEDTLTLELSPIPNLQVSSVTAPETAFSSQDTIVEWTVSNVGTGGTNAPVWYDTVYLSLDQTFDDTDTYLGRTTNPSYLNTGDSYSNSLSVTLPQGINGNYYFLVQTDAYNYVTEVGNEGDNWGAGSPTDVDLTPPPDLQVTNVNAPIGAFSGQPMNLSWTVTNEGNGRTLETAWWDRVFMSEDETLDASDRILGTFYHSGALNAGDSYTGSATVNLPIGVDGDFFFFVQSDIYNQVYEHIFDNNNSNLDTTPTSILLTPPPDLEFETLVIPNNARSGSNLTINYRVTNYGATETPNGSWIDTFYLSTDEDFDPITDIRLGSVNRYGILNPGDSYERTANFALSNTLTGTYYVFGVTDDGDRVFELDNDNNLVQSANQVEIVSQPVDLVVTEAVIPTTGEAGKSIQVQWTVQNQGVGDTIVTSWSDRIVASVDGVLGDADDITLATFSRTGLLTPNQTYSRTETVALPFSLAGDYQFFVVTDATNNVYEGSNEGNNGSNALPITIARDTPDLQVTAITLPTTLESGTPVNISWTVENLGFGRTNSNYWYDDVYLSLDTTISNDDISLGSVFRSGALNVSESYTATATFNLPVDRDGNYHVLVRTDRDNNVIEGNFENNNVKASDSSSGGGSTSEGKLPITPTPTADLTVQSVDAPTQGIAGQPLTLTWTVANNGAATGANWYDAVYLSRDQVFDRSSDIYLGFRNQTGVINEGESYTVTESFNVPRGLAGRYYAFVVTDSGNAVYERDGESNNTNFDGFSTEIILPAPSDLVVTDVTVPNSAIPGQGISISYSVENQGTDTAFGTWTDSVYLSRDTQWDINDTLVGQVTRSGNIASGDSYSQTLNGVVPGVNLGDYHVIVRSDIRNQVPEVDESNNVGVSGEQVTLDVEVLTLDTPDTGTLAQGQAIYYRFDANAGQAIRLQLDSSSDQAFNELYVSYGEMPTRGQFDLTTVQPFNADPEIVIPIEQTGTYYVLAYGDQVSGTPT
ncbi:CARDB domain-containing protein, partial [Cyanothece sp. BG0011]|uniref:CARDB domain-containing protein n=1 Tax=Cyanothece sp. BG0011 TaxID=2082950 RepID=UPI0018E586AC